MTKNKKRFKQLEKKREEILKSNDPTTIARHLVTVLNDQGYSTRGYDVVPDLHNFQIYIHGGVNSPLEIENLARGWRLKEND